ncbi:5555_t:CDS:2, partial [Gigaspora margarita]
TFNAKENSTYYTDNIRSTRALQVTWVSRSTATRIQQILAYFLSGQGRLYIEYTSFDHS